MKHTVYTKLYFLYKNLTNAGIDEEVANYVIGKEEANALKNIVKAIAEFEKIEQMYDNGTITEYRKKRDSTG